MQEQFRHVLSYLQKAKRWAELQELLYNTAVSIVCSFKKRGRAILSVGNDKNPIH